MMKKAIMAAACLLALAQGFGSAQEMRDTVRAAKVFPKSMANALMAKAARHFGKTYAKDYITQASFSRIIRSKGIPCKIYLTRGLWLSSAFTQNYKGLYFDDPNDMGRYVPTDSFVSLFFLPGRTDPIDIPYVNGHNLKGFEACLVNYSELFPPRVPVAQEGTGNLGTFELRHAQMLLLPHYGGIRNKREEVLRHRL